MNSLNKHFLDLEYTGREHHENLYAYKCIANNILKEFDYDRYKGMDLCEYYNHITNMYFLAEEFIEQNIDDVENYFREIIMANWYMLVDDPLDVDIVINELWDIYDDRNWKYSNANEFGIMYNGTFMNLNILLHKILRIQSHIRKGIDLGEDSFEDAIQDLTNYCMIYLIWMEKGMPKLRNVKVVIE